jgi:hypothetical protein
MRRSIVALWTAALALGLAACGGSPKKAGGQDCFDVWNANSNRSRQTTVAGRFTIAGVSLWQAQASNGNVGGPAVHGCGYLFHDATRYLSISAERKGSAIRWGAPPTIRGTWSAEQQAATDDNAALDGAGLLSRR